MKKKIEMELNIYIPDYVLSLCLKFLPYYSLKNKD